MLAVRIRVRFRRWIRNRGNGSCQQAQQYYTAAFHFVSLSLGTEAITHSVFRSSGCIPTGAIWQAANIANELVARIHIVLDIFLENANLDLQINLH